MSCSDLSDDTTAFLQMLREFPLRTGLFTFGLPVFALCQLINGYVHQRSLVGLSLALVVLVMVSVLLTQYQLAVYRRTQLTQKTE